MAEPLLTNKVAAQAAAWLRERAAAYRALVEDAEHPTGRTILLIRADALDKAADTITAPEETPPMTDPSSVTAGAVPMSFAVLPPKVADTRMLIPEHHQDIQLTNPADLPVTVTLRLHALARAMDTVAVTHRDRYFGIADENRPQPQQLLNEAFTQADRIVAYYETGRWTP